ncbi:class I SAM-dependent methyltransferase [Amycolatopsis azurea]|uniref:Putative methyltransferase n=1 Tax=Amycolatopsis azurea DSM 43854 TaxID=1238180 RepID=M2QAC4_9PSEU|nr:class I SAM-dependent methyltransferase [Amycolatopsis azurea]EMD23007.1 putative methyltransferase [Amycolatopsis azurea DSM 43854]OOC08140.1 hypothetical protein B0293_04535 [Amycolatopsis azurea DSM 43854]
MLTDESRELTYETGFLSKDRPSELTRLRALERSMDPTAIAILESLPVQPDWHSLEMGAGAGSMAYWLAERCAAGSVIAADLDPRYIEADRLPNLESAKVDLAFHEFPAESFDLVHGRIVLSHIPEREEVLRKTLDWLKPQGWLMVEDMVVFPQHEGTRSAFAPFLEALTRSSALQGSDATWSRRMPNSLVALGLLDVQLRTTPMVLGLGGPSDDLWRLSIEQFGPLFVERGTMTQQQLDALHAALAKGELLDFSTVIVSAWGRRP